MSIPTAGVGAEPWQPSYLRHAPRWYDGIARLLDLGSTFDLRVPQLTVDETLEEDARLIHQDMLAALERLHRAADET